MKKITSNKAPAAIGPYSQAIISGGLIYVSGQLPINMVTNVLETDPVLAVNAAMTNIGEILKEAKTDLSKLVKVTIFLKDLTMFPVVNEAYAKFLSEPFPARACVEVSSLPKGAILEIECIPEI